MSFNLCRLKKWSERDKTRDEEAIVSGPCSGNCGSNNKAAVRPVWRQVTTRVKATLSILILILINNQLDAQILLYIFISILYMFRATLCSSSGESIVSIQHLVYVTLCRWPSGMQVEIIYIYIRNYASSGLLELYRDARSPEYKTYPYCLSSVAVNTHEFLRTGRIKHLVQIFPSFHITVKTLKLANLKSRPRRSWSRWNGTEKFLWYYTRVLLHRGLGWRSG